MERESDTDAYGETGTTLFSDPSFSWRKLNIGHQDIRDSSNESVSRGGAMHYQGSGQLSSPCRNRSIQWRHDSHSVLLIEISLDHDLVNNALHINLASSFGLILGDITIHELSSHVVILFLTSSHVFRLVLPHPDIIAKDPKLSAAGKGLHPSVLTFAKEDSFSGTNMVISFPSATDQSQQGISSTSSWIGMDGVATFAYGLPSGVIHCVKVPPPGASGIPERFELNDKSVVTKFWNLLPTGIRGSDDVEHSAVSMAMHSFDGELIILVLCKNGTLKLWSVQQKVCVMEHSLMQYLPTNVTVDDVVAAKLSLHKSQTTAGDYLNFGVYFGLAISPQLSIFQLVLIDSQLVLDLILSHSLQVDHVFIDLSLNTDEWWMVCRTEESNVVTHCCYTDRLNPTMNNALMKSLPLPDIVVGESKEPREAFLDAIFSVDNFSLEAVSRALKLYGPFIDQGSSTDNLREEVITKIEEEIVSAAMSCEMSHDDYRELVVKCWNKFYACCLQYEKLTRTAVGISCDPVTGMVVMVQQGTLMFLQPMKATLITADSNNGLQRARDFLLEHISTEVCEEFFKELSYNEPLSLINEIVNRLTYGDQSVEFIAAILQILSEVTVESFNDLMEDLIPVHDSDDADTEDGLGVPSIDISIADLYSSSLTSRLISGAMGDLSRNRIEICRDVLIILMIMEHSGVQDIVTISELNSFISRFSKLLSNYHIIYWLCTTVTTPTSQSIIDANLKMMSNLRITENFPISYSMRRKATSGTLMELFISTCGRTLVMRKLLESSPFQPNVPVYAYWRDLLPWLLEQLIKNCWPEEMYMILYQSLLTEGHYILLQELHEKLTVLESDQNRQLSIDSREFFVGQSYIGTGENMKALECFIKASNSIKIDPLLIKISENDGGYWTVCMRLLEEARALEAMVQLLQHATTVLSKDDEALPLLWSNLFKYLLELKLHQKAYYAMMNNPDPERSLECLKHFVVVLSERKLIKELCNFTFCGMEEEVEHVMELRARSVDVFDDHQYYDLMYCYYISREKYWKAAHIMYEYGLRSGLEAKSVAHVQQECNCYAACLTALKLVNPKYHWIVIPIEQVSGSTAPKNKGVRILKLLDIQKKFELVQSKLQLLKRVAPLSSQLCNPYVTFEEVQTLLCSNGLYDIALKLSVSCSLPLIPVYESLAGKCAVLNFNALSLSDDHSLWEWLSFNDQYSTASTAESRSSSIVDQAWNMLHLYLQKFPNDSRLLKAVARKLLSLGCNLPQWLICLIKESNPDALIRLYLQYDMIPQAVELVIEYLDAVMGHGSQHFGLKSALHIAYPPVWLPYTSIDQLINILDQYDQDSSQNEMKENLERKLDEYSNLLERTCAQAKDQELLL